MSHKIFIADDDPGILEALQITLEDEGYQVETADNGLAVLQLQQDTPDLVLMDVWMSGQDGRQVCNLLKHQPATRDIPVIMISANTDTSSGALASGADDFLAKPFDIDVLLQKVTHHLTKKSD